MTMITIKCWLDSGANIHSTYETEFEVDADEWAAMPDEEKENYAKNVAWGRMDWGWEVQDDDTN